jgi:probable rRNA maturation factor
MDASAPDIDLELDPLPGIDEAFVVGALTLAAAELGVDLSHGADLGVTAASRQQIKELNREHRAVDSPTDVLSFPMDGADVVPHGLPRQLGDLVVCQEYVADQVARGDTLATHEGLREPDETIEAALRRCIVHGLLHLLGMDHESEGDLGAMFALEQRILDGVARTR